MIAGCSMSDSTPPSDSAQAKTFTVLRKLPRRLEAALDVEGDHPAEALHLLACASACCGCEREARVDDLLDLRVAGEQLGDLARRSPRGAACARGSVLTPRSTRKQSIGPGTPPTAFCRKCIRSASSLFEVQTKPPTHVGVAVEVLGGRVHDDVDAELQRPLEVRRHEGVVADARASLALLGRSRRPRARSTSLSIGLVGVSTQTSLGLRGDRRLEVRRVR